MFTGDKLQRSHTAASHLLRLHSEGQIHVALTPAYLEMRGVSLNVHRRIYAPYPQNQIRLKIGFFLPAYLFYTGAA